MDADRPDTGRPTREQLQDMAGLITATAHGLVDAMCTDPDQAAALVAFMHTDTRHTLCPFLAVRLATLAVGPYRRGAVAATFTIRNRDTGAEVPVDEAPPAVAARARMWAMTVTSDLDAVLAVFESYTDAHPDGCPELIGWLVQDAHAMQHRL